MEKNGAVKVSVESVVETLVSRYEQHFTPQRQDTDESSAMEEMNIAENGPHLQHADSVIEDSMNSYWKDHDKKTGNWHFIRRSDNIRSYTGKSSKVVGGMMDRQSRLPFMDA